MDRDRKKMAAAISTAVQAYIQSEQQAGSEPGEEVSTAGDRSRSYPVFSPWALSGRQAMMDWRRQLQYRILG